MTQTAMVSVALAGLVLFIVLSHAALQERNEARSLLAEKYNFTEDECVNRVLVDATTPRCSDVPDMTGMTIVDEHGCTLYCHTAQIPDGEECTTEERPPSPECHGPPIGGLNIKECYFAPEGFRINITTCTPKYRTERTLCATPQEIAKVREVIG